MCTDDGEYGVVIDVIHHEDYDSFVVAFDNGSEDVVEESLLELTDETPEEVLHDKVREFVWTIKDYTSKNEVIKIIDAVWS